MSQGFVAAHQTDPAVYVFKNDIKKEIFRVFYCRSDGYQNQQQPKQQQQQQQQINHNGGSFSFCLYFFLILIIVVRFTF